MLNGFRRLKMSTFFSLVTGIVLLSGGVLIIGFINYAMRQEALSDAKHEAMVILDRNLATHSYFSRQLKPEVFKLAEEHSADRDYFNPVWMSSTYAVREIDQYFKSIKVSRDYYYKEAAINARSPRNEADRFEAEFLRQLNKNAKLKEKTLIREIDGKPFFVVMRRGETMEKACLRCHSTPERAPRQMVSQYGPERSFNRQVGEVVSVFSLRIPLETGFARANMFSVRFSLMFGVLLAILFAAQLVTGKHLFFNNIARIRDATAKIASDDGLLGQTVSVNTGKELIDLADAFNTMSINLRRSRECLEERIEERTASWRKANEKLNEANSDLAKVSSYKSEFLANVGHEMRTPLTAVLAFTEELLSQRVGNLTSEQEEYLKDIQDSGRQLLELINNLLDLSRITSHKLPLKLMEISLGKTVLEEEKMLRSLARTKAIEVITQAFDTGTVIADADRVRQVIRNLLGNAIKFSPPGGQVEILIFDSLEPEKGVVLVVKDTGPGIPAKDREHIFEAFYQGEGGLNREYGGTGLGLALVKKIVELHRGRIELESIEGQGTAFAVYWPEAPVFDDQIE